MYNKYYKTTSHTHSHTCRHSLFASSSRSSPCHPLSPSSLARSSLLCCGLSFLRRRRLVNPIVVVVFTRHDECEGDSLYPSNRSNPGQVIGQVWQTKRMDSPRRTIDSTWSVFGVALLANGRIALHIVDVVGLVWFGSCVGIEIGLVWSGENGLRARGKRAGISFDENGIEMA